MEGTVHHLSIIGSPFICMVSGNFGGDGYQIRPSTFIDEVTYFSDDVQPVALKQARDCNSQAFGSSYLYCYCTYELMLIISS
jgi:hypothetical protein